MYISVQLSEHESIVNDIEEAVNNQPLTRQEELAAAYRRGATLDTSGKG